MTIILPYRAEYATEKKLCSKCRTWIFIDDIRFAIMQQCLTDDELGPVWYGKCCFFTIRRPVSIDVIEGFANLQWIHQQEILSHVAIHTPPSLAVQSKMEEQNSDYFDIYDKIKSLERREKINLLKERNQFVPESDIEISNHLTDILCFGSLPLCPVCTDGKLTFRNNSYHCTGYDTPWSTCSYSTKEPKRSVGPHIKLLGEKKVRGRTRILHSVVPYNPDDFELHTKQPLFDMEFFIVGETQRSKSEIVAKIHAMGGKIAPYVHNRLAAIISNLKEVTRGDDDAIREAFIFGIQMIPEDFLEEVMTCNNPIQMIVDKNMSHNGKDPYERLLDWKKPIRPMKAVNNFEESVDPMEKVQEFANVYTAAGLKYAAVLNFVDINSNKNSYFKVKLCRAVNPAGSSTQFHQVIETQGRIGTSIQSKQQKTHPSFGAAEKAFKEIYLKKTGNEFGTNNYVKKPGKFFDVKINFDILTQKIHHNSARSDLNESLHSLMRLLFSKQDVIKATLLTFYLNFDAMPIGLIDRKQVQDALDLLHKIKWMLCETDQNKLVAASNQFYSYFPHGFGLQRPPIIDTQKMVQEKIDMLKYKLEKEHRYELLTSELNVERNLLDVCYEHLCESADINMLNKSSGMYKQICEYVQNTQLRSDRSAVGRANAVVQLNPFEVNEVYEVIRHEELLRYAPYEENFNRQLLFHGTSINNFCSILTNGLKIAPPEAHFHGSIFGKGIYFSDSVSKAAAYCHPVNGMGLVLLCEVAVGISDIRYYQNSSKLIDYCESVQAMGQYYPHPLHVRHDGLKIPNGQLIKRTEQTGILFNEFVVFDESRVKIRYLVKVKFN